jgi:hypothetical protein
MSNFGFIFKNANPESKPSKQNNCFFFTHPVSKKQDKIKFEAEPVPEVEVTPEVEAVPEVEVTPETEPVPEVEVTPETEPVPEVEVTPETEPVVFWKEITENNVTFSECELTTKL